MPTWKELGKKDFYFFILVTTPPKTVLTDNQQTLYKVSFPMKKKKFRRHFISKA